MRPLRTWYLPAFALLAALRTAIPLTTTVVLGHSMEPTLHPGAFCVLDRGYYRSHTVSRGDVVVLKLDGVTYIKRVSALPGDHLWLLRYQDGGTDELLDAQEEARLHRSQAAGKLSGRRVLSLVVPPGECFVLGDNSSVSVDSREFGPVPLDAIVGRAMQ